MYLTIKEPFAVSTDDSGHSSRPSQASRPDGCRVASLHSAAFHLPVPLIAASPFVPLVRPAGCRVSSLLTPDRTVNTKLDRKTSSEDRGVVYQTNRKGLLKTTEHSLTVLD